MKTALFLGLAAITAATLASCNDKTLAGKLDGSWEGDTATLPCPRHDNDGHDMGNDAAHRNECASEITCTPTVTFTRNKGTDGGNVELTGKYTITRDFRTTDSLEVKATISGTASASGAFNVEDEDDIRLDLQPGTTNITVEASSLSLAFPHLSARPAEEMDTLRTSILPQMETFARTVLERRIASLDKIEDVKVVDDSTMTAEIHDAHFTFRRK